MNTKVRRSLLVILIGMTTPLGTVGCRSPSAGRTPLRTKSADPSATLSAPTSYATTTKSAEQQPEGAVPKANADTSGISMLTGKPYLTVQVDGLNLPFEVFVNGGDVTTDGTGRPASERWPINPLMRSGENEIGLLLYSWKEGVDGQYGFDAGAKLTVRVLVRQAGVDDGPEYELCAIAFDGDAFGTDAALGRSSKEGTLDSGRGFAPAAKGDVEVGPLQMRQIPPNQIIVTRRLNLRLPFPEWAFFRGDTQVSSADLPEAEIQSHYDKLLVAYEEIWQLLASRRVEPLMPLFEERSREYDLALYQEPGTTQAKLKNAFESALATKDCHLAPLRVKDAFWYYNVAPGGRLARLSAGDYGGAVIRFKIGDPSSDYARVFPIAFRKQGDRYIVSR